MPYSFALGGGTMIVSRKTATGVEVSDSYMVVSPGLAQALNNINNDPAWVQHCANTLNASEPSILQGDKVVDELANKIIFGTRPKKQTFGSDAVTRQATYAAKNMTYKQVNLMRSSNLVDVKRVLTPTAEMPSGYMAMLIPLSHQSCVVWIETDSKGNLLDEGNITFKWQWSGTFRLTSRSWFG